MTIQHQKIFSSNSPQIDCVEYQKSQAKQDSHKGTQRNQLMDVSGYGDITPRLGDTRGR